MANGAEPPGFDDKVCEALMAPRDDGADDDEEAVEVIVELQPLPMPPGADRRERIAALRSAFDEAASAVRRAIADEGGEVTAEVWLNQTIRAVLPKRSLLRIAAEDAVVAIDQPKELRADVESGEPEEPGAL